MTNQNKTLVYNVAIYHLDNQFYVIPLVRMPPTGLRTQVLPLAIIPDDNPEKLAQAIESARLQSDVKNFSEQNKLNRKEWNGDNERVWNTAQITWDILWRDDGSVSINPARPSVKHKNGVEWEFVKDAKKFLLPLVSAHDIAQEILNQLHNNTTACQ